MIRKFINGQRTLSKFFDQLLSEKFLLDGNSDFADSLVPKHMSPGLNVYDIGGGKNPFYKPIEKRINNLTVYGLDIDSNELERAPEGAYDKMICAGILTYHGDCDADVVICQTLLEHVQDQEKAITALASILKPGGVLLIFVPCRNALFARLNLFLPEKMKKKMLSVIQPKAGDNKGFKSYYDQCTLEDFNKLAAKNKLDVVEERYYYSSSYFNFFFPFYLFWRLWVLINFLFGNKQAVETFSLCLRKAK